ncbi:unnamed protein product [Brassicogethes aeneus]|uniref:DUF4806 domain-containing protein n=1 Tax=Brassicogethes aeneus TaxID=1431903 RepID=A0A9P0FNR1_BRAAE|nr:unnamed protein product [Brassicogethes aeneus]
MQRQQVIIDNFKHSACPENQLKIMQQLAKLEVMLDSLASKSQNNTCSCKTISESSLLETKDDIFFDQIDTSLELQELEAKLADQMNMEEYIKKFRYVFGRKGSSSGINNCYTLVDKLFSRQLFTLCSWAGGSRDGKEKNPFKVFKNILNLFFRVVRLSDDSLTLKDCEEFFKGIIRNSTK